jgi:biopolymer transport protein ExbB/TolQ
LITAIPSLVAWNYYNRKVESLAVEMAAVCDTFLHQLYHGEDKASRLAETPASGRH